MDARFSTICDGIKNWMNPYMYSSYVNDTEIA